MGLLKDFRREAGQMTVEAAVVFPVLLAIGFISVQAFVFLGDCAAFDLVARDAIRLQADDGTDCSQCAAEVCARIEEGLGMDHESVSVSCERTAAGHMAYKAKISFSPPFLRDAQVFGVRVPALEHELSFSVSPYRSGVVV